MWILLASACLEALPPAAQGCSDCHGSATSSAPPTALGGATDVSARGVGAHQAHLLGSTLSSPVACAECHLVPVGVDDVGHVDTPWPAEVSWANGALAKVGGEPFDATAQTCVVYCHGATMADGPAASPGWTDEASLGCTSCHGSPPSAPHPDSSDCGSCHENVVGGGFADVSQHLDGIVQATATCSTGCHGSEETPAPPEGLGGATDVSARGVGAHEAHVFSADLSAPVACEECHLVPLATQDAGHVDTPAPAEVTWANGVLAKVGALPFDAGAQTCVVYCHGATMGGGPAASPAWTDTSGVACTSCHGFPPPAPHPQDPDCGTCHPNVAGGGFADVTEHIDGIVQENAPETCTSCHGAGDNAAPPPDTSGSSDTSRTSVGAHDAHVLGTAEAAAVACTECHVVPVATSDPGHLDPPVVTFGLLAARAPHVPVWNGTTCADSMCHNFGGGTVPSPEWTTVDGSQIPCNGCHSMPPPPAVHPPTGAQPCGDCHGSVFDSSVPPNVVDPSLHVNGRVNF